MDGWMDGNEITGWLDINKMNGFVDKLISRMA